MMRNGVAKESSINNEKPLISVVIPVYNVEQYLRRCLDSVVNQPYNNLQIILIDDGSTDDSSSIIDQYADNDRRIIAVHKENGGLSSARNVGLQYVSGDYIGFIDSDDWVSVNYFDVLISNLISSDCDIIQCDRVIDNEYTAGYDTNIIKILTAEEALSILIDRRDNRIWSTVWGKLFKANQIDITFVEGVINEDEFFTYRIIEENRKYAMINAQMYHNFIRSNSIMNSNYSLKRLAGNRAFCERHSYIKDHFPSLIQKSLYAVYEDTVFNYQMALIYLNDKDKKEATRYLKETWKMYRPGFKYVKQKRITHIIWWLMSIISLDLTCRIRNRLKVGL